ncbi:hypothetical protein I7I50_12200 [Histoplasma capsulatum G186AR]|nr:hypothetical protein I7I52_11488 [Histoplasma capsulatum]QSS70541.1 hypothetical protein I7I50_12200 [Histoplasma capsulatum G186AR]
MASQQRNTSVTADPPRTRDEEKEREARSIWVKKMMSEVENLSSDQLVANLRKEGYYVPNPNESIPYDNGEDTEYQEQTKTKKQ